MIRRILITSTALTVLSVSAFAQTSNVTIVREVIPQRQDVIVANSPQDLALQEEIRKIRASNAYVDSQIGISDSYTTTAPVYIAPAASYAYAPPIPAVTTMTTTNRYQGRTIELFEAPLTQITYTSTIPQQMSVPVTAVPVAISATIVKRRPVAEYTRFHRVTVDDTLYRLAKSNCVSVADIQDQNAMSGTNIRIGQTLALPANRCETAAITRAVTATASSTTRSDFGIVRRVMPIQTGINVSSGSAYAVLPKDSLYSIGRRYCVSAGEIAGFNGIDIKAPIQPGQILRLPATACNK